jgi:acyl-CoA synthetase (AMP-forming)/AMP-acid ligase II
MRRRIARRVCDVGRFPALVAKRSFCRGRLAACEVPRLAVFRVSLPKSSVGKYLRRKLRDL